MILLHIKKFAIVLAMLAIAVQPLAQVSVSALTAVEACDQFNPAVAANIVANTDTTELQAQYDGCVSCTNALANSVVLAGTFYKLFFIGYFIPVLPDGCTKPVKIPASGTNPERFISVPLPLTLIIRTILRVYSFIASLAIYLLLLALLVIATRWIVGGLSGSGQYADVKRDARNLVLALFIILIISTLVFELLRIIGVNESILTT